MLTMRYLIAAALAMGAASPAMSATRAFNGNFQNTNLPAAPGGRCAPAALTVSIGPGMGLAAGVSNLGAFTPTNSHCINPPLPTSYTDGEFSFDFGAGDALYGTYDGVLGLTGAMGTYSNLQNFVITGGAGRFLNASGAFTGTGTVVFAPGQLPFSDEAISGTLEVPGVPEPASWLMLLLGFGTIGLAVRGSPRRHGQKEFSLARS